MASVFHILTGALTQRNATSQPEAKPRSKQNPRHLNRFHRPYLRLVPCRLYMSRFPIFPARCTSVTNPSAASNGNCASKWVYFSTSAIWILRSNSPAGPLAIPPAEWKHEPDASCPDPRRTDARRHPVDPPRADRHRHPAALLRDGDLHRLLREGVDQYQRAVLPGRP